MTFEVPIIKLLTDAIAAVVNQARLSTGRRTGAKLISEATQELLSVSPNLPKVKSLLTRAEKALPEEPAELFQARSLLEVVATAERRPTSRKKATKKRAAKRKASKKRATKR
jgi:hypothetical protein